MTEQPHSRRLQAFGMFLILILPLCFLACQHSGHRSFSVRGVVQEVRPDGKTAVIKHESIPGYMDGMTMAFDAKTTNEFAGVRRGDEIQFRLVVTREDSWIESITKTGRTAALSNATPTVTTNVNDALRHPLMDYAFTNQLGQPVTLSSFRGQGLAITFFFTRCPI